MGRRGRRGARDAAGVAVGPGGLARPAVRGDGRRPPDLDDRHGARPGLALRRHRRRGSRRRRHRRSRLHAAVRAGHRRRHHLRRRRRGQHRPPRRSAAEEHRRRRSPAATCSTSATWTAPATPSACSTRRASPPTASASTSRTPTTTASRCSIRSKRTVKTLAGTGKPGLADGRLDRAQFDEPGGLSLAGRTLFVTDANNHAIRAIDLDRGTVRSTLALALSGRRPQSSSPGSNPMLARPNPCSASCPCGSSRWRKLGDSPDARSRPRR